MPYTSFVKTADNPTVFGIDGTGNATAFSSWDQLLQANNNQAPNIQTVAQIPAGSGYSPLPQLNQAAQPAPQQSPIDAFNMKLMELLGKAQGANSGNAALASQASHLQIGQTNASMAPADPNAPPLRPGDALNARQDASQLYNPEVKALNDRMQLNNEAVQRFTDTIKAAKDWGEEYYKSVKPDDATIQAVQMQMRAGIKPSEAILDKVRTSLTQADWDALAAAGASGGGSPTSIKEYEYAKSQGYTGTYIQWEDRNKSSGGGGATVTERLLTQQQGVLSKAKGIKRGANGFANPKDWLAALSDYIGAKGTTSQFISSLPPEEYLSPSDAQYVRSITASTGGALDPTATGSSGNWWDGG
jgi:hypothetical protein